MKNRDYKLNLNENQKIVLKTLIFFIFAAVVVFHNVAVVSRIDLPPAAKDSRLTSLSIQNEINLNIINDMYERMYSDAIIPQFYSICKNFYKGKKLILVDSLFTKKDLLSAGFSEIKINTDSSIQNIDEIFLCDAASKSLWYSPLIFSPVKYSIVSSFPFPLVTEPVFDRNYPLAILFIQNKQEAETIIAKQFKRYVVFYPIVQDSTNLIREAK
ncbi:MAG: hypothetical protein JXR90_17345 [Spirochaetes bacterium]|nr:hypothetical protein [Spirochaetota bacterium]